MSTLIFPARTSAFSALPRLVHSQDGGGSGRAMDQPGRSVNRIKLAPRPDPTGSIPSHAIAEDPEVYLDGQLVRLMEGLPSLLAPPLTESGGATRPTVLPLDHLLSLSKTICTTYHPSPPPLHDGSSIQFHPIHASTARLEKLYLTARKVLLDAGTEVGKGLRSEGMILAQGDGRGEVEWLGKVLEAFEGYQYRSNRLIAVLAHLGPAYIFPASSTSISSKPTSHVSPNTDSTTDPSNSDASTCGEIKPLREITLDAFRDGVLLGEKVVRGRAEEALRGWLSSKWARANNLDTSDGDEGEDSVEGDVQRTEETVRRFLELTIHLKASGPFVRTYTDAVHAHHIARSAELLQALRDAYGGTGIGPSTNTKPHTKHASTSYVSWAFSALEAEEQSIRAVWSGGRRSDGTIVKGLQEEVWGSVRKGLLVDIVAGGVSEQNTRALEEAIDEKDHEALKKLYVLLTSVSKFTEFRKALSVYVKTRATELISDATKDAEMVPNLLSLKRELEASVFALYDADDPTTRLSRAIVNEDADAEKKELRRRLALEGEVRDGLKSGVESRQAVPAEMIAKHLDQVMRRGQGSSTTAEFESSLDEIVDLVKFTKDKDVFKEFFTSQLAKRLLLSKSASGEEEMSMIKKLQREYGEEFTSGDAMMKDLSTSEDMNKRFVEVTQKRGKGESKLTVNVLSQGHWPPYKQLQEGWEGLTLPTDMQKSLDEFAGWYNHTYSGRILSWRHQHTTVTLTARFPGGNKEIGVSLFQSLVLLQFSSPGVSSLSFEEIAANTGIERGELIRTLQSLFGNKQTRMLNKKPAGKEVVDGDRFAWNEGFTRDRMRFKINQLQQDMSAEESKQTSLKVFEDRTMTLDAQIVRIMKGAKQMSLSALVNETVKAVERMFVPEVKGIKEQVESLIEREYMERDDNDRNLLKYLA